MPQTPLPSRVRVAIIGGGIHGVGLAHDLVSRGWTDVLVLEKSRLGSGTSSKSTKLIHGGLRYLQNPRDFPLVKEALQERKLLIELAPDLVKPLELLLPLPNKGGLPAPVIATGLWLYDFLSGPAKIAPFKAVEPLQAKAAIPPLKVEGLRRIFSFWDGQTDDLALVRRVAASARKFGAKITENTQVESITPDSDGFKILCHHQNTEPSLISARYIVNAAGPWANMLLEKSGLKPHCLGVNSEGIHLMFPDMGLKAGLFLQDPKDHRIFFLLPWLGATMVGTTEDLYTGNPDDLTLKDTQIRYLIERSNPYLDEPLHEKNMISGFTGLRWLAVDKKSNLSKTSRADLITEHKSGSGILFTIYGGKLTSYRKLSENIGNSILRHFGEQRPSQTQLSSFWASPEECADLLDDTKGLSRFDPGGLAYLPRA